MAEAKRRYGAGSAYQRKDGMWVGTIEAGFTGRGTRRRITVSATTKAECLRRLRAKQVKINTDGMPAEGVGATVTVKSWGEYWIKAREADLRPTTLKAYRTSITRHIIPAIGMKRLSALTPADMRDVATAVIASGCNSTTANVAHRTLKKMLRDALVEGHQVPARILAVRAPSAAVNDRDSIPLLDALAILKVATEHPAGTRWVAALLQGMRQGECLGLTWDAVDLDAGTIDVSWQLQRVKHRHTCPADEKGKATCGRTFGAYCKTGGSPVLPAGYEVRHLERTAYLVRPKTAKGTRIVPLVPWMAAALRDWRQVAPANRHGLVWASDKGAPITASDDGDAWRAIQAAAGVAKGDGHYVIHEARHTTATLLLEAGIDVEVIKAIMGQSNIITTRGYQHVNHALALAALHQLADRLNLSPPTATTEPETGPRAIAG